MGKKKTKKGKKGKNTKANRAKRKSVQENVDCKPVMEAFMHSRASNNRSRQSIQSDRQVKNEEDIGIARRLRSRGKPVTYDDIDFDF